MEAYSDTLCEELIKLQLEIVVQGKLNTISLEPTLLDKIMMAQLSDKGVKIIKQKLSENDPKYNCFHRDSKGTI